MYRLVPSSQVMSAAWGLKPVIYTGCPENRLTKRCTQNPKKKKYTTVVVTLPKINRTTKI
jgi:hypothetical protein